MSYSSIPLNIEFLDTVDSTNNYLKHLLRTRSIRAPFAISAYQQTSGRGQREKVWKGEPGKNIYASFLIAGEEITSSLAAMNGRVALAVCSVLTGLGLDPVRIKWPNDVYVGQHKIAGVLIENIWEGNRVKYGVVGVGLNVNQQNFEEIKATSIVRETGQELEVIEVLHALYESVYHAFNRDAEEVLVEQNKALYRRNELVTFESETGITEYEVLAIMHNGNLMVRHGEVMKEIEHHKEKWVV